MEGKTQSLRKKCSTNIFLKVLMKCSSLLVVSLVSFLGGYLLNTVYPSNQQEMKSNVIPIERRSTGHLISHFQAQLLSSFKAENLEENLR